MGISSSSPSPTVSFSALYDGDGKRATKTVGNVTTYYLYDGDELVNEETTADPSNPVLLKLISRPLHRKKPKPSPQSKQQVLRHALLRWELMMR